MRKFLASLLLVVVSGCHVADIPIIGWRLDLARQQKKYREWHQKKYGENPKTDQEQLLEEWHNQSHDSNQTNSNESKP